MRRCGFKTAVVLIAGCLFAWPSDGVSVSDSDRAERSQGLRDMATGTSSSSTSTASLSSGISSGAKNYNAVYNTNFFSTVDASQMIYEDQVQQDLKGKQLASASEERAFLESLTTPYEEEGNRVQGRVIAEENAYLKLLARQETEKRLRELEKEKKEKEKEKEIPQRPLWKAEISSKKERVEETESLSDTEKRGIISRMVFLEFDPPYAASVVNTLNSKKEIRQFLLSGESPERLNESQVDWVVAGT